MTTTGNPIYSPTIAARLLELRDSRGYRFRDIANLMGYNTTQAANAAYRRARLDAGLTVARRSTSTGSTGRLIVNQPDGSRTFGVEIEVIGLNVLQAYEAIKDVVRTAVPEGQHNYNHRVSRRSWKVVYDGSVGGGAEVVSPPMSGANGEAQVVAVMRALRAAGGDVDTRCGLHVHHDVQDLTGEQYADVLQAYYDHQTTMDSLVAPSRRNATYTRHFSIRTLTHFADAYRNAGRHADAGQPMRTEIRNYGIGGRPDSRYHVLNVHCFPTYGTLEFRQHQGTLNGTKAVAWIRLGQAFIEAVKQGVTIGHGVGMLDSLSTVGLPTETHTYLGQRMEALAA